MTTIRQEDLIQSIADGFQYISYFHPKDYIQALGAAYEAEESPAAKDAMAQILVNSRMCAEGHRPICQDTGMGVVFLKIGMDVRWDAQMSIHDMVNEGVRRAYAHPDNLLRASIVSPPIGERKNTRDNTPAVIHMELVPGDKVEVQLAAKGGGSENKSKFTILNPSDSLVDWVLRTVPTMGAGWCPPGMLGIGIGGSAEKAMLLAKESLMEHIDIHELKARGPSSPVEELRLELFEKVNALGIGAQGLGGLTTILDVKIKEYPTHAASLAGGHHPELRSHPARPFHPGRQRPGQSRAAEPRRLAGRHLGGGRRRQARKPGQGHATRRSPPGSRVTVSCSPASCSPGETPPTSASSTCWTAASPCRRAWTSPIASSTTWVPWTRCGTRS